jgi:hypothetical protein
MTDAADALFKTVVTAWTKVPSGGATNTETIRWLQGTALRPLTLLVAVLAMTVCATKVAWEVGWGGDGRSAQEGLKAMLRTVIVGGAGTALLVTALAAGDEFSSWVLAQSTGGGVGLGAELLGAAELAPGLGFVLGLLAIFACLIQIALLVVRSALVVLLAGAWQVSAAASATDSGAATFKKITAWLVAFVIYKPAAAVCYATAFKLASPDTGGTVDKTLAAIEGVILLFLAILALPALLRLVAPAAAAMGGPSVGGALAGTAAVATGAITLGAGGLGAGAGGGVGAGGLPAGGPASALASGARAAADGEAPTGGGGQGTGHGPAGAEGATGTGADGASIGAGPTAGSAPPGADPHGGNAGGAPVSGASPSGAAEGPVGSGGATGAAAAAGAAVAMGAIEGAVDDEQ